MTKLDFFRNAIADSLETGGDIQLIAKLWAQADILGHSQFLVKFSESGSTGHLKTGIQSLEHFERTVSSTLITLMKEVAELLRRGIELDMQLQ